MKVLTKLTQIFGLLGLAACSSPNVPSVDDIVADPSPFTPVVFALHSPNAPDVNIYVDGELQFGGIAYTGIPVNLQLSGTHNIQIEAILPGGATAIVIDENVTIPSIPAGSGYVFLAVIGDVADLSLLQVNQEAAVTSGSSPTLVTHASPAVQAAVGGPVDVYVTAPGVPLAGETPAGSFSFGETLDLGDVPLGTYQVRVGFDPGTGFVVAYDSGPVEVDSSNYTNLAAIDNTSPLSASPALLFGFSDDLVVLPDVNAQAGVRVVHASNDAGSVDVSLTGPTDVTVPGVNFLDVFPGTSGVAAVPPGEYEIAVTPAGAMDPAIGPVTAELFGTIETLVVALGTVTNSSLTAIIDAPAPPARPIPLFGQVRIVHAAEGAGAVDIFVLPAGADAPDVDTAVAPTFSGFAFQAIQPHVPLDEGAYDIYVTPTGTRTAAITALNFPVTNGDVVTVIAVDGPAADPTAFSLVVLEDNAVAP